MSEKVKKLRINQEYYCKYRLNTHFIPGSILSLMLKSSQKLL